MISLKINKYLISFILVYYTFCIFSHTIISSAHFIEHLIEHKHYHLDEFHSSANEQPYKGTYHQHSFLINTFLSFVNENVPSENIDEVLLKLIKLNLCLQESPETANYHFSLQGNNITINQSLNSQNQIEPLVPPPQTIFS